MLILLSIILWFASGLISVYFVGKLESKLQSGAGSPPLVVPFLGGPLTIPAYLVIAYSLKCEEKATIVERIYEMGYNKSE